MCWDNFFNFEIIFLKHIDCFVFYRAPKQLNTWAINPSNSHNLKRLYILCSVDEFLWFHTDYGDEKPAIIKKKRRRKKKGKKHKPFKVKDFKKLKKFMLPLLLAYKLKFFTLVPLMLGGLVLIVATTGFAGFFFALFAVGLGLKGHH